MHNLKNKLIEDLKTYDEAAKADSGALSSRFVSEVALLAKAIHYLCKIEWHMNENKGEAKNNPYGVHKDVHHHDHMKYDENAKPNMFE